MREYVSTMGKSNIEQLVPLCFAPPQDNLMIHVDASFVCLFELVGIGGVVRDGKGH